MSSNKSSISINDISDTSLFPPKRDFLSYLEAEWSKGEKKLSNRLYSESYGLTPKEDSSDSDSEALSDLDTVLNREVNRERRKIFSSELESILNQEDNYGEEVVDSLNKDGLDEGSSGDEWSTIEEWSSGEEGSTVDKGSIEEE